LDFFSNYAKVRAPVEINILCLLNTALSSGKNMKKLCWHLSQLAV